MKLLTKYSNEMYIIDCGTMIMMNKLFEIVAAAPYNYNFLDTTKEPSAYLPGAYPYGYSTVAVADKE